MPVGDIIGGVLGLGGALIGSSSAGDAAAAQTAAANTAAQTQLQMYNQTRSDLAPFMSAGSNAFSQLANIFGFGSSKSNASSPNPGLATSLLAQFPGYQFGLDQGTQALDRSAAAKGIVLSGAQLKDAQTYGQNYAMQQAWQPYISELNSAAGLGENAAAGAGNAGTAAAAGAASSQLAAGQSIASGDVSQGNIWQSALGKIGSSFGGGSGTTLPTYTNTAFDNMINTDIMNKANAALGSPLAGIPGY